MPRADLALVGFGSVGRRFASLLREQRPKLLAAHGLDCRIVGIATGRHGAIFRDDGVDAEDAVQRRQRGERLGEDGSAFEIVDRLTGCSAPIRVVVETTPLDIVAAEPALVHVERALDAGLDVVTANKGPVAFAYRRLRERAAVKGVSFLFEGAVMDGVPIFNLVRETLPALEIRGFRGIVNTTTQHVLLALERGEELDGALRRMQAEGIAEADPALDIEGWDAAAKTAALANVLMDADLTPHAVERAGLDGTTGKAARDALATGRRLRLVVAATREGAGVRASVGPTLVDGGDLLAALPDRGNALILSTDLLGEIAVCQLGGDVTQTAYALLSDLITIVRHRAANQP